MISVVLFFLYPLSVLSALRCGNSAYATEFQLYPIKWIQAGDLLTWYFHQATREETSIAGRAFETWMNVSTLRFAMDSFHPNISISWGGVKHENTCWNSPPSNLCNFPFRLPTVGHTFYPGAYTPCVELHVFEDFSEWDDDDDTVNKKLFAILLHEIGHTIGIMHSSHEDSIMYESLNTSPSLTPDDILAIQTFAMTSHVGGWLNVTDLVENHTSSLFAGFAEQQKMVFLQLPDFPLEAPPRLNAGDPPAARVRPTSPPRPDPGQRAQPAGANRPQQPLIKAAGPPSVPPGGGRKGLPSRKGDAFDDVRAYIYSARMLGLNLNKLSREERDGLKQGVPHDNPSQLAGQAFHQTYSKKALEGFARALPSRPTPLPQIVAQLRETYDDSTDEQIAWYLACKVVLMRGQCKCTMDGGEFIMHVV